MAGVHDHVRGLDTDWFCGGFPQRTVLSGYFDGTGTVEVLL